MNSKIISNLRTRLYCKYIIYNIIKISISILLFISFSYSIEYNCSADVCLAINEGKIEYNSTKDIYGIKLQHDGCIEDFFGGAINQYNFEKTDFGNQIAFYPKKRSFIPSGEGVLFEVVGEISVLCLTDIIIMTDGGFTISSGFNKVFGCMNPIACNYNLYATVDDNSCELAQKYYDCSGNCLIFDECNVCGGNNSTCADCSGTPNGEAVLDNCNMCDTNPNNDCIQDCAGIWGGETIIDRCNVCGGDNSACTDCLGIPNGNNKLDMCNNCDEDSNNDCTKDCAGKWGGNSKIDECGVCINNGKINKKAWNNTCQDCKGIIVNGNPGPNYEDKCGICDEDPNNDCIQDCAGIWGGETIIDECGICGGIGIKPGRCDCDGTLIDCMGVCGGNSKEDRCGICNGDNKSCGATYIWPTNASNTVTAFFGEERPRRYHAGIDVRTYGKTGYKLFAIGDGYIERIRTSSEGYGKAIYLHLYDGNVALYAHLEKFTPEIDIIIHQIQEQLGEYTIDYTFNNRDLIIKKGDLIGYSGDTGSISGPHLHFEIRNKDGLPINPLHEFSIYDNIAPIPRTIAFIPYDTHTTINGYIKKQIHGIAKKQNIYVIEDTLRIKGRFGIALDAIDKINKQPFDYGLYSIELFVDGKEMYDVVYDIYNFNEAKYIYCERDFGLKKETGNTYYRLFANHENENLLFIGNNSSKFLNFDDSEYHNIKIIIKDFNGNSSTIIGTIINKENEFITSEYNRSNSLINFTPTLNEDISYDFILSGKHLNDRKYLAENFSINNDRLNIPENIELPFDVLEIIPKNKDGTTYNSQFINLNTQIVEFIEGDLSIEQYDKFVLFVFKETNFSDLDATISLKEYGTKTTFPMKRFDKNTLITEPLHFAQFNKFDTLSIVYDSHLKQQIKYPINQILVTKNEKFHLYYNAKELVLEGENNTFFDSTIVWTKATTASVETLENAIVVSGPYFIGPDNISFNNEIDISISVINPEHIKHSAIYYYDEIKKKWHYMTSSVNNDNKMINSYILSGGIFAVIQEELPPEIFNIYPGVGGTYYQDDIDYISFNIKDNLSGINGEYDIELRIDDGKPLIFEYNSYQNKVYYRLKTKLEKGIHDLYIHAFDRVGNQVTKIGKFRIK